MTKKARIDSAPEAVRIMQAAGKRIDPPSNVSLTPAEMTFFASVIDEFAKADWSAHQLELAAMLARKMCTMERLQRELEEEGYTLLTEKGWPAVNPKIQALRMLDTSIISTRRSIGVHARAKHGEARDQGKRAAMAKGLEADLDDELLARPN